MNKFAAYRDATGSWLDIRGGACPYCILTTPHRHRLGLVVEPLDPDDVERSYEDAKGWLSS